MYNMGEYSRVVPVFLLLVAWSAKEKNTYKMLFSRVEDAKMISKTKKKEKKKKRKTNLLSFAIL